MRDWISVEDRLPEQRGQKVKVLNGGDEEIARFEMPGRYPAWMQYGNIVGLTAVTHWQPIRRAQR